MANRKHELKGKQFIFIKQKSVFYRQVDKILNRQVNSVSVGEINKKHSK